MNNNGNNGKNGKNGKNGNHAAEREPILRIRDLKKTYMQGKIPVHALDGVSLDVNKGELLSIAGCSGCYRRVDRAADWNIIV